MLQGKADGKLSYFLQASEHSVDISIIDGLCGECVGGGSVSTQFYGSACSL